MREGGEGEQGNANTIACLELNGLDVADVEALAQRAQNVGALGEELLCDAAFKTGGDDGLHDRVAISATAVPHGLHCSRHSNYSSFRELV